MAQRVSGYPKRERSLYETPEWVTELLLPHIDPEVGTIWEPACASGKIVRVLKQAPFGYGVLGTDLETTYGTTGVNFLNTPCPAGTDGIITNPPFNRAAEAFIRMSLRHIEEGKIKFVAMLLPVDFDSGKTRRNMFADCPYFSRKLILTRRILWFKNPDPKKNNPSQNHAWFVWNDQQNRGATIKYLFSDGKQ